MNAKVDSVGRVVIPKALRDALGLVTGSEVEISRYGKGVRVVPHGRTGRLERENGHLVVTGETTIDDETVFALIHAGRK